MKKKRIALKVLATASPVIFTLLFILIVGVAVFTVVEETMEDVKDFFVFWDNDDSPKKEAIEEDDLTPEMQAALVELGLTRETLNLLTQYENESWCDSITYYCSARTYYPIVTPTPTAAAASTQTSSATPVAPAPMPTPIASVAPTPPPSQGGATPSTPTVTSAPSAPKPGNPSPGMGAPDGYYTDENGQKWYYRNETAVVRTFDMSGSYRCRLPWEFLYFAASSAETRTSSNSSQTITADTITACAEELLTTYTGTIPTEKTRYAFTSEKYTMRYEKTQRADGSYYVVAVPEFKVETAQNYGIKYTLPSTGNFTTATKSVDMTKLELYAERCGLNREELGFVTTFTSLGNPDAETTSNLTMIKNYLSNLKYEYVDSSGLKEYHSASELRKQMVSLALSYQGLAYVWGGESLTTGADCSGFVWAICSQFISDFPARTTAHYLATGNHGKEVTEDKLQPGDLVFYYGYDSAFGYERWAHVAIYIGDGLIVHAKSEADDVCVTKMTYWSSATRKYKSYIN